MAIKTDCPCCRAPGFTPFYEATDVPAQSSVVFSSAADASGVPTGDIVLALCSECGFVGNAAFDEGLRGPEGEYEDQQGFSPTFSTYAAGLADRLVVDYDLKGRRVLEIGCGKGDFLWALCERGECEGVGVDPLARPERLPVESHGRVAVVPETYSEGHARYRPDLVVCRHTLEHIGEPLRFLETLRRTLEGVETPVVFEVPDAVRVFEEGAFWDVYYEHCAYFTPTSLAGVFRRAGFDVTRLERVYGDQYLVIDAKPGQAGASLEIEDTPPAVVESAHRFAARAAEGVASWRSRIEGWHGNQPVLWGSGSKSVAFVTTLRVAGRIGGVVDVNPFRHGRYAPGFEGPILAPSDLRASPPDLIVVMNPVYVEEITEMVRMGVAAQVVAV